MASSSISRKTVTVKTFLKWKCHDEFEYEMDEVSEDLTLLKCKICSVNYAEIRKEAKRRNLCGNILDGILNYTDGVRYIHKANFDKHVKSGSLHDWAKKNFVTINKSNNSAEPHVQLSVDPSQTTIFSSIGKAAQENYTNLIRTALHIALKEKPYSDFSGLIDLQRSNGLKFLEGKIHRKACAEFIECLAKVVRNDLREILNNSNFYSTLFDGSQPKKTFSEKELLFAKVVIRGEAVELLCKCIHMDDYGSDAADLKRAFDETLKDDYQLHSNNGNRFTYLLVSHCADGASVNMGRYNGACTLMRNDEREWLLIIHCSNHRLELAIADAY